MLGSDFDIALGVAPVDLAAGASTGFRLSMNNLEYVTVLFVGGASAAGEEPVLTLKQHTASTGGTTADLACVTEVFTKSEATLDNDETWVRTAQAASATVTGTEAVQQMIAFRVRADSLASGNRYISVNIADAGETAQLGCVLYILSGVNPRGLATSMRAPLR